MSATRDTTQKIGWTKSNLYRIYKEKTGEVPKVSALEPLQNNLDKLQALHAELKTMIDELEALVKE